MPILHVIPSFSKGGAENVLKKFLTSPDLKGEHAVVCLRGETGNSRALEACGIKVFYLNLSLKKISNFLKLKKILDEIKPNILQGWMYHSNLICFFVNIIYRGRFKIYWNIRRTYDNSKNTKILTKFLAKISSYFSRFITVIIYPSKESLESHVKAGYSYKNSIVIENGCDENIFKPDPDVRKIIRNHLKIENHQFLIGYIARFHLIKGYDSFIKACSLVSKTHQNLKFIMIGRDIHRNNKVLIDFLEENSIEEKTILVDEINNVNEYLTAMDLFISCSYCEGFCNTLAEAMLTGVPAIATDVGNSKDIILYPEALIPSGDIQALEKAISNFLSLSSKEKNNISDESRNKIINNYSLKKMSQFYNNIYC
jgi:glycosyltransferase involved in cell wall biosynthesis